MGGFFLILVLLLLFEQVGGLGKRDLRTLLGQGDLELLLLVVPQDLLESHVVDFVFLGDVGELEDGRPEPEDVGLDLTVEELRLGAIIVLLVPVSEERVNMLLAYTVSSFEDEALRVIQEILLHPDLLVVSILHLHQSAEIMHINFQILHLLAQFIISIKFVDILIKPTFELDHGKFLLAEGLQVTEPRVKLRFDEENPFALPADFNVRTIPQRDLILAVHVSLDINGFASGGIDWVGSFDVLADLELV